MDRGALDVYLGRDCVGLLRQAADRELEFTYLEDYRRLPNATPVSVSLPINRAEHPRQTVTNFFEGLLPEHGPARERLEIEAGVPRTDSFGLLAYVGRDLPGAVALVPAGEPLPKKGEVDQLSDLDLSEMIADLSRAAASGGVPHTAHGQWSLAGAQAKIALSYVNGHWGVPRGATPTTHIVKPAVPGFEDFDVHEVVLLGAARTLGLPAADAWVQRLADGSHAAVIVRYDRTLDGSGTRIHQEDLGQALGYPPWRKYERLGGPGVARIAYLFDGLPASNRDETRRRFFDALAFSYAIAGTDGHVRNYSLLLSGVNVSLAPLYDINSALPYTRPRGRRFDSVKKLHSSFVIGSSDAFTRITAEDWVHVGGLLGLAPDESVERVVDVLSRTPSAVVNSAQEITSESGLEINVDWASLLREYHDQLQLRRN